LVGDGDHIEQHSATGGHRTDTGSPCNHGRRVSQSVPVRVDIDQLGDLRKLRLLRQVVGRSRSADRVRPQRGPILASSALLSTPGVMLTGART
jgi:hypothetical protein